MKTITSKTRWLLYIISFGALCIQVPVAKAMSVTSIRRLVAVSSIPVRTIGSTSVGARIAALYNKYRHGSSEGKSISSLEEILTQADVVTQTQSHHMLSSPGLTEDSYEDILKAAPYFNSKDKRIHYDESRWNFFLNSMYRFFNKKSYDTTICKVISAAHNREIEEVRKGNVVAYHGQRWELHRAADIYKELQNLMGENKIDKDYIPLRFSKKIQPHDTLHMNFSLFSNAEWTSRNSFFYFVHDFSVMPTILLHDIFQEFELEHCYKKYKHDFGELEQLHRKATVNGNLLLLSFTPQQAEKWIIGNFPIPVVIKRLLNGRKTSETMDITCVLQAINVIKDKATYKDIPYSEQPFDKQFIDSTYWLDSWTLSMGLTPEILDPKTGPKIYSFNTSDQAIIVQYETKKRELFDAIKADMPLNLNGER